MSDKDKIREEHLKQAANLYVEAYGKSLLSELDDMQRQRVTYMTPRTDAVVRDLSRMRTRTQRRKLTRIVAAVAACLVIAISIPQIMDRSGSGPDPGVSDSAPAPVPTTIDWTVMQPLSFTLPEEFEVESKDLDNGMSIYRLESSSKVYPDNVVLTMQRPDDGESFIGTETVYIDNKMVHTKLDDGYKMLLFEKDDKLYTLSSENDMGTLTYLYRHIEGEKI